ncbi:inorganic phosphate cotransporter [Trichonephila inaurata madagascariensis]|uniref:Inorganic phosphate cotransporter n=1 Tax=Trichonephila inaurata madagascariensis TaxID=2747483 RepID=A0A8X7CUH8_9ARAC|nr:inorganic phosphate cotransporter [Trichonephila inaurata madagascariensis]
MSENRPAVPWKKILTSVPCYAYYYGLFGHYWSIAYYLSVHPTFMGTILHFSMTENGATSCLPVAMKSVGGVIASLEPLGSPYAWREFSWLDVILSSTFCVSLYRCFFRNSSRWHHDCCWRYVSNVSLVSQ